MAQRISLVMTVAGQPVLAFQHRSDAEKFVEKENPQRHGTGLLSIEPVWLSDNPEGK